MIPADRYGALGLKAGHRGLLKEVPFGAALVVASSVAVFFVLLHRLSVKVHLRQEETSDPIGSVVNVQSCLL